MGIFDKVFGKKEISPEERSDKSLAGLTMAMATFNGGVTMGEVLKGKKIPNKIPPPIKYSIKKYTTVLIVCTELK